MATVIEAIYENGVFRPLRSQRWHEHQRVRLRVEPLPETDPDSTSAKQDDDAGRVWGSYESWLKTFEEMPKDAGIDDAEGARIEAEMKQADLRDSEKTLEEIRRLLGSDSV